jgi:hypothetical protein
VKIDIDLKKKTEPAWSAKVDRWYQLDEVSYVFCEALHQWNYLRDQERPEVIFVALPGASNLADFDFVTNGASSPAKFVYTLPNICAAVIFQMLDFSGKVYCLHQGKNTIAFAQEEARSMAHSGKSSWLFASPPALANEHRTVYFESFT